MSRCFPFPPPGYEKKTRAEDIDLLKKEKHREKKQKKEKKDKEKKESKEKREKDRSDEKQKEKKEKKDKNRDKKKDREKSRDKDKNNQVTSDEKKLLGHAEADKGERNYAKSKDREKEKITVSSDKVMGHSAVYNGVVVGKNSHLASENKNYKQLHELSNKIAIEEGKRTNLLAENYPSMELKKDVGMPRIGVSTPATPMAPSERSKERKVSDVKMDRHGPGAEKRPVENMLAQKFTGMTQNKVEGVVRQVEKNAERRVEVKEKIMGIEGDGKKGEKRKDEDREKSVEKYKERDKKIKVEKPKDMGGEMLVEQQSRIKDNNKVHADLLRGKEGNRKDLLSAQSARPAKLVKEENKAAAIAAPEIIKKRKEFGPNGVLHEGDVGPNKKARVTSSSLPITENGRRPSQNSTTVVAPVKQQALSHAKQDEGDVRPNKVAKITSSPLPLTENGRSLQPSQALSSAKLDYKDHRINGTINSLESASKASRASATPDRNSGAVKKLSPHPDTKHLAQILSVPKVEDWSEFDEQEWLFSSSYSEQNKPKAETSWVDDTTPQVWAEPLRIESADVFALPYVIPR